MNSHSRQLLLLKIFDHAGFTLLPVVAIFGFLALTAFRASAASDFGQFIQKLQQHYDATTSFTANFKQTLTSAGGPSRRRSGKIFYQKPGKLRWEFSPPQSETIVSDGMTLFDFDPGLNQVVEMPVQNAFKSRSAAAFFLGLGNLQHDFTIESLKPDSEDQAKIKLKPKSGGDSIELVIDKHTLNIEEVHIADALGNTNQIDLSDLQRNLPLDASLFKFTPPADADIVTAPKHL